MDLTDTNELKKQAAQKEQEWKHLQELRIHSLEEALKRKDAHLSDEKSKFTKLKDDFKYNMKLLQERDAELQRCDIVITKLKASHSNKDREISALKISIDELKEKIGKINHFREEMQRIHQQNLREKQAALEQYKSQKDAEINEEREKLESSKLKLEFQLKEMENKLDIQRQELNAGFDQAIHRREHEHRVEADKMSTTMLAHEMKVKLLMKETDMLKSSNTQHSVDLQEIMEKNRTLLKELNDKDWELQNTTSVKDARIYELETKLQNMERFVVEKQDEFKRKYAHADGLARERESALHQLKKVHSEKENNLKDTINNLSIQLEQTKRSMDDTVNEKCLIISNLNEELTELKDKLDTQESQMCKRDTDRNLQMEYLSSNEQKMKAELIQKKGEIESYKKELTTALKREADLKQSKVQIELDWQRKYESIECQQFERSEELIKSLTKARNEALSDLKDKTEECLQKDRLIESLRGDHNQALSTITGKRLQREPQVNISSTKKKKVPTATLR